MAIWKEKHSELGKGFLETGDTDSRFQGMRGIRPRKERTEGRGRHEQMQGSAVCSREPQLSSRKREVETVKR